MLKLLDKHDPLNITPILVQSYKEQIRLLNSAMKKIFQLIEETVGDKSKEIESLVLLSNNMAQTNSFIKAIQDDFMKGAGESFRKRLQQSYKRGKTTAVAEVNRVYPERQPTVLQPLDKKDLKLLRILQDTNFDMIKTLTQKEIAIAKRIFVQGLTNNNSAVDIIDEIRSQLGTMEFQTRRIVYTELTRTTVTAQRKLYLQAGMKYWRWNTAIDERVCPVCGDLHGKVRRIGEDFSVFVTSDKGKKKNKGAKILQPPAHPFCRCGMSPMEEPPTQAVAIRRRKKKPKPKKKLTLIGFTNIDEKKLKNYINRIPEDIQKKSKVLNGTEPIIKGKGSISDIKEAKDAIPEILLNKYRNSNGIYLGGDYDKIFLSSWSKMFDYLHEIGHSVFRQYVELDTRLKNRFEELHKFYLEAGTLITHRSSNSISEHFSDVFSAYLNEPEFLRSNYPILYNYMKKYIFKEGDKK